MQHPRTGTPINNPFLPVRDKAAKTMREIRINGDCLWPRLGDEIERADARPKTRR